MSMKSTAKKTAGYMEEETGEALGNDKMARKGRNLRNEGRAEKGEPIKTGKPGTGRHH